MTALTPQGQQVVNDLSQRYGVSTDAVLHMLIAVVNGNGSMAQFSHPEFGGGGQWMRGGMTMVGDMFNHGAKILVDNICNELSNVVANQPGLMQTGSFQSQSQSSGSQGGAHRPQFESSLFVPDPRSQWYPIELGQPSATGSQNNARYAYFANARRLAVETAGEVWVYDVLDHQIGGFSQQQSGSGSITFTSQYGTVALSSLPVVTRNGQPVAAFVPQPVAPQQPTEASQPEPTRQDQPAASVESSEPEAVGNSAPPTNAPATEGIPSSSAEVFEALERLGSLRSKDILTEEEFASKKTELLSRL